MVVSLYDCYVRLPTTDEEWQNEIRGFLENFKFPCKGTWDGFHVYINSQLKNYFTFKKRYSITNVFFTQLWVHLEVLIMLDYWKSHL